ncbi:protein toll [Scaptodrosophila lebanonensis]|uniref:Protein toll n=1 Tax=Drosophila lebanonensis TaxID=7225 RepID=A0A6J2TSH0_DROLE|nr:protein toll [Scaptodrosophila lebanonensis]
MLWLVIVSTLLGSALAQIVPLSTYCNRMKKSATNCMCESESNLVVVRCTDEYAMQLEQSDRETNIFMSYYDVFDLDHLPCFNLVQVTKFEFDAYNFWNETFWSDLQSKLGIESILAIEVRDRRVDNASRMALTQKLTAADVNISDYSGSHEISNSSDSGKITIEISNVYENGSNIYSTSNMYGNASDTYNVSNIYDKSNNISNILSNNNISQTKKKYNDTNCDTSLNKTTWFFSYVQNLSSFTFESDIYQLEEDMFQAFTNLTQLELKLSVDWLPPLLFAPFATTLQEINFENSRSVNFSSALLRQMCRLENVTVHLGGNAAKLQPQLFTNMSQLREVHLLSASSKVDHRMFRGSHNLRIIQIVFNDFLNKLPVGLFRDQFFLTDLDLHSNSLSELPVGLFSSLHRLQTLDLSRNKLCALSSDLLKPLWSLNMLNVNYNSLIALESATFSELRSLSFIDMRGTQFYGTRLSMHYEALLCTNDVICQYKAETWQCASDCICWVERDTLELIVDCRGSALKELPELPHTRLVQTIVRASNNSLKALPSANSTGYANVTELHLAHNHLKHFNSSIQLPINLTFLDVRYNHINGFSDEFVGYLENSTLKLALAGNPLHCDCNALPLLNFVRAQPQRVRDIGELQCATGTGAVYRKAFQQLDVDEICPSYVLLIGCIVGGLVVLGCLICTLYLAYRQQLKIWLYNHNWCLWWVSEEELDKDKLYDAFISYSHKDEELITKLLPKLETGPHAFRVCLHSRDWLVGDCIPEQIVRTVEDSKRILIILSQHFIESVWARMEFRIAYQATLRDKRKRIIIILYKELENFEGIDSELRAYLKLNTYLKWGDPLFWSKLRYAMPHNRRVLKGQTKRPAPLV